MPAALEAVDPIKGPEDEPETPAQASTPRPAVAVAPHPGLRVLFERRLDSWADRLLPDPVRDRFVDGGLISLFAGLLLILGSVLATAGSCSYLAATGERVSTGWLAGLLLVLGVGLVVHGWIRGGDH